MIEITEERWHDIVRTVVSDEPLERFTSEELQAGSQRAIETRDPLTAARIGFELGYRLGRGLT